MSSSLGLLSSTLYAVAPAYMFVLVSRLLTGISAGMEFTTELTFIAKNTKTFERTTYLASVTDRGEMNDHLDCGHPHDNNAEPIEQESV